MRRGTTLPACFAVLLLLLAVIEVSAGNWPRFRGPNGTGISDEKGIPVKWTGKHVLWKAPVPGQGNSSPVVWGDQVYVQSASADGKERYLLCFSLKTGDMLWKQTVSGAAARKHTKNTLASSTPATDGQHVVALFWDGQAIAAHAFSSKGERLWVEPLGSFTSQHGVGLSPVIHEDKVYLMNDQDGVANVVALDLKTGKKAWETPRQAFRACYSTPFILEKPGDTPELIVASTAGIAGYNLTSGSENWRWTWSFSKSPLRTVGSPVAGLGMIFANSGDGSGDRHTVAVRIGGKADFSGDPLVWEGKKGFGYVPTMLVHGEHLYLVIDTPGALAACYAAKTGENVWTHRLGGNVSASPIIIDGKMYVFTEEGDVHVLAAAPKLEVLAKNSVGEPVFATPAAAGGRLLIRGRDHLFCVGER